MEGFKIVKNTNEFATKHIRAKCCKAHAQFVIRIEYDKSGWCMVYATKTEEGSDGLSNPDVNGIVKFDGGLNAGNDYACPYCGNKSIVRCGKCGRLTCNNGTKKFRCEYCGNSGTIRGRLISAYAEPESQRAKK